MSLAEKILKQKKTAVSSLTLIPSGGGVFEVEVDGKLVFSKKAVGRFPDWSEIAPHVGA
ncbi:MAG: SelT/SelW/SelH family protein [Planctomycetota bacterium]|nr:MAG: SelT/SelW/SelH family protein [Planctomycetota bacterium]